MSNELIIFGAGGHAKVVIETARKCGYRPVVIYDDNLKTNGAEVAGVPVKGSIVELNHELFGQAFIAIGSNRVRKMIFNRFKNLSWPTLLHPAAYVSPAAQTGCGTIVCAGAVVQPDVVIGSQVIINTSASIDHECVIGDFAHVCPGCTLAGGSQVGEGTMLGTASCMIPLIRVGGWCEIAAGSVVVRNLADNMKAAGVPARSRNT